jgi:hypothetical protein
MTLKQNFLPSMAFRPFLALEGVKSRGPFTLGEKNAEFYLFIVHLEQYYANKF